jgi:hypothetical protein
LLFLPIYFSMRTSELTCIFIGVLLITLGRSNIPMLFGLCDCTFIYLFLTVLGLELRAFTLSHFTSPFL